MISKAEQDQSDDGSGNGQPPGRQEASYKPWRPIFGRRKNRYRSLGVLKLSSQSTLPGYGRAGKVRDRRFFFRCHLVGKILLRLSQERAAMVAFGCVAPVVLG